MDHADHQLLQRCLRGEEAAWLTLANLVRRLTGGLAAIYELDPTAQMGCSSAQGHCPLLPWNTPLSKRWSG